MSKKGAPPIIIPKKVNDWIRQSGTFTKINNYKVGGGIPKK